MQTTDISDPAFRAAVQAIDHGDLPELIRLIAQHPALLCERLVNGEQGYFKDPYLLYFVADNPIRNGCLPKNITAILSALVGELTRQRIASLQQQLDYTLGLVTTGRTPQECGVQIEMVDLLIDAGARPGGGLGALAHGNVEAARRLIERGGALSLATAVGLDRTEDIRRLAPMSDDDERLIALTVAAFYGKTEWIAFLLSLGVNPNGFPNPTGFHTHATPLHQAVSSGSLSAVKQLVEAGADVTLADRIHHGTPLGWARYMESEESPDAHSRSRFSAIVEFLQQHCVGSIPPSN